MNDIYRETLKLLEKNEPHVLVTLIGIRGEAPSDLGNKILVTQSGLHFGTVGGGKVEAKAIQYALDFLSRKESMKLESVTWNLQKDVGMTCGGEVTILFEKSSQEEWHVAVFGAGHVAQALVPLLCTLDCGVTCVDTRSEWMNKIAEHPHLRKIVVETPKEVVSTLSPVTFIISMTQGHAFDVPVLEAAYKQRFQFPYIGVIGSAQKAQRIKTDLKALGVSAEALEALRCPIGLPIGSNQPSEIAISVAAELLQVRDRLLKSAVPSKN